ncbi:putative oxidoreductase GLYR1 homolog [Nephila pilipes]|uniref:Cytokine-like nuclear factor N-PAC n=1 Tax=Nephila pilipes TaxID=299642 RepID=A0A8X6MSJ8_NEPPI|nr:putative oxidoreductase GLYR1 homolog [Nephila pilipes]
MSVPKEMIFIVCSLIFLAPCVSASNFDAGDALALVLGTRKYSINNIKMSSDTFEIGELVWAKVKNFPFWPGQVAVPPPDEEDRGEGMCYMCLLGSRNYLWVPVERVRHHSERFIPANYDKRSDMYKKAIDEVKIVIEGVRLRDEARLAQKEAEEKNLAKDTQQIEKEEIKEKQPVEEKEEIKEKQTMPEKEIKEKQLMEEKEEIKEKRLMEEKEEIKEKRLMEEKEEIKEKRLMEEKEVEVKQSKQEKEKINEKEPIEEKEKWSPINEPMIKKKLSPINEPLIKEKQPPIMKEKQPPIMKEKLLPREIKGKKSPREIKGGKARIKKGKITDVINIKGKKSPIKDKQTPIKDKQTPMKEKQSPKEIYKRRKIFEKEKKISKGVKERADKVYSGKRSKVNAAGSKRSLSKNLDVGESSKSGAYKGAPRRKMRKRDSSDSSVSSHHSYCYDLGGKKVFIPEREPSPVDNRYEERLKMKHVTPTTKKIGFIGLGRMGRRIVKNLLIAGHKVTVWNRTAGKCKECVDAGAVRAENPAEVVKLTDIIFSCVSDANAVRSIVSGPDGILKGLEESCSGENVFKGYVEMSSIDFETSQEIGNDVILKGARYLEAPVTGTKNLAAMGSLLVLAAGDALLFRECVTCFHSFSDHAYYISGNVGDGSKYNIALSMFTGTAYSAMAETLALGNQLKVNTGDFIELLRSRINIPKTLVDKGRAILSKDFSNINTALKNQQKDMSLAIALSDKLTQPTPIACASNAQYVHARLLGYGEHDVGAVYQGIKY